MRASLLGALLVILVGCSWANRDFVSDLENCRFEAGECTPEQASHASLAELRELGSELVVTCEAVGPEVADYSLKCHERVRRLVSYFNKKFGGALRIESSELSYRDQFLCIDTFIPGREAADCAYRSLMATIRLRWPRGKGA